MITILSEDDLARVSPADATVMQAVSDGLVAQAQGAALAEPTTVFNPVPGRDDLIAVIRGALPDKKVALIKTVGGFPGNADRGLPTNPGCLTLIETETGQITGILPAARITTERTAMVSAIGALRLARPGAAVLGCIGTRGISVQAARYIAGAMDLREIHLHGRDPAATAQAADALSSELGLPVTATPDWQSCLQEADIMIDGAALPGDRELFPVSAMRPGDVLVVFGAYSALPAALHGHFDRLVMDRWVDDGRGSLGPLTRPGLIGEADVDALIGDVITGSATPRQSDTDRIVFCHRGVAACDLALADAYLSVAREKGLGTEVPF